MLKGYFSSKIIQHQCPNTHTTDASLKTHITLLYGVIFYSEPESHSLINSSIWTIMTRETGANFRWFRFNYRQRTSCASDPKDLQRRWINNNQSYLSDTKLLNTNNPSGLFCIWWSIIYGSFIMKVIKFSHNTGFSFISFYLFISKVPQCAYLWAISDY